MKIQHKIILAFLALTGIILLFSCILAYYVSGVQRKQDFHSRLGNRAMTTASLLFKVDAVNKDILKKVDSVTINSLYNENIRIYNGKNELLYRSSKSGKDILEIDKNLLDKARVSGKYFFTVGEKEALAFHYQSRPASAVVVITAEDRDGKERLSELFNLLVIAFCTGLLLSIIAGWLFSRKLLDPLNKITQTVNTISAKNLEKRLSQGNINDEWAQLTKTFNHLLTRLQESFEMQGRFIANASHELSTPLTAVNSQIDVALQQERNAADYKKTLLSVKEDVAHLTQLTKSLLEIARTSRGGSLNTSNIRVDEILLEVPIAVKKNSHDYKVLLQLDELPEDERECTLNGNYDLLLSAFKNIAENGCKYSTDNEVIISLSFVSGKIILLFKNKGNLAATEIEYLFQPFFRGNDNLQQKGYGMGLSLARRIILLHKGEIKAENLETGEVLFTIIIPSLSV